MSNDCCRQSKQGVSHHDDQASSEQIPYQYTMTWFHYQAVPTQKLGHGALVQNYFQTYHKKVGSWGAK